MAKVLMVVRILPKDSDTNLDDLAKAVAANLPNGVTISEKKVEEIGFGLKALVVGFLMPEVDGIGEALEQYLSTVELIGEFDVQSVTRI
ncbi:MAG: elongation factor 1-beta [Candidatus Caldarchaeum sp.]|uniref:Elongation factor 1-beta n=1 Tax=Caldiarchaeum subterraneum TaxID=311458 RepID=A0A7C5Y7R9_CALS0